MAAVERVGLGTVGVSAEANPVKPGLSGKGAWLFWEASSVRGWQAHKIGIARQTHLKRVFQVLINGGMAGSRQFYTHSNVQRGQIQTYTGIAGIYLIESPQVQQLPKPQMTVILMCDSGLKYLSIDLWK